MTSINWSLLQGARSPVDTGMEGYQQGRAQAAQRVSDDALRAYAANPSVDALAPLIATNPTAYGSLAKIQMERDALARSTAGNHAYATYLRQNTPGAAPSTPAASAPAVGGEAAPMAEDGSIVVTAPQPRMSVADVAEYDPALASKLSDHMAALDKDGREQFAHKTGVAASVAQAAIGLPLAQRQDFIDSNRALLKDAGWTDQEIDGFDPHDQDLEGLTAIGVGADKYLADRRQAAGQAITVRGQDVSAATARRGQDIGAATARRGQDMSATTAAAGQAVTMRGQDMAAASKTAPTRQQTALARTKLTSLDAIEHQLNRAEAALNATSAKGSIGGLLPGSADDNAAAADAAIANLGPLIRQLTRVPGEGSMSDYESRLAQAGLPSRWQAEGGRKEAIASIRDLINNTRAGYQDMLGDGSAASPATGKAVSPTIRRIR